uniref:DUF309 domain-containing protein n=1 Tax=Kalanchoe fedtschenkoi TaxID=63787 RepID=A0A7N0VES8_KALFE
MVSLSSPSSTSPKPHLASPSVARSPIISYPPSSLFFFPMRKSAAMSYRVLHGRFSNSMVFEDEGHGSSKSSFNAAVVLFNSREYYTCHDVLEALWNEAEDPLRTLYHGILQCAVGFHHLFNQNHKGAMMELGEGLCKLRKMEFQSGPFLEFEREIAAALEFIYQTQIELAACAEDLCLAMDQTERSYQLLGGYAAGQQVYFLEFDDLNGVMNIVFRPDRSYARSEPRLVKLPILQAVEEHLQLQT